jgi:hypothetical protein
MCVRHYLHKWRQAFTISTYGPATFESASRAEDLVEVLLGPAEPDGWSGPLIIWCCNMTAEYGTWYGKALIAYQSSLLSRETSCTRYISTRLSAIGTMPYRHVLQPDVTVKTLSDR